MSRTSQFPIVATLCVLSLACQDTSTEATGTAAMATLDSAGVDIVRISDVHMLDLPEIETRLVYSTAADPDLHIVRVAGAVFLPDTSLVVADGGSSELVFFDRDGGIRARSGREGEGPGEYSWVERIGVGTDGVPFVFDRRQRRFTFLDAQGEVTDIHRLEQGAGLVLADDSGEIVDTLSEWAGKERHVSGDQTIWTEVGFSPTALFAGHGRHALMGTNDSLDLTLYRGPVPLTRIRGGYSPRTVTAEEREEWTETFLGMFPADYQPGWRERLEQSTVRETYPAYGAISVEADGRCFGGTSWMCSSWRCMRWGFLGRIVMADLGPLHVSGP